MADSSRPQKKAKMGNAAAAGAGAFEVELGPYGQPVGSDSIGGGASARKQTKKYIFKERGDDAPRLRRGGKQGRQSFKSKSKHNRRR